MTATKTCRIDVRLDETHRTMLDQIVEQRGITVSEFVREAIEAAEREWRIARVNELLEKLQQDAEELEPLPPWEVVKEQIMGRFDDRYADLP